MQFEPLSDEYVQKLASSDEDALRHFIAYFGSIMVIKLRARALPQNVIDEIRQETFARVLLAVRKADGIRDSRKFGGFVLATCNHVLSEHFRKDSRFTPLEDLHIEQLMQELDIEKVLLTREIQRKVHEVLRRLPARDREILTALFLDERDKDVVCHDFGVDRGYLRVLLHRAKNSFREQW